MKKTDYKGKSLKDLHKALADKRTDLRNFRFGSAGAKARDTKLAKNTKKDVARIMTELNRQEKEVVSSPDARKARSGSRQNRRDK